MTTNQLILNTASQNGPSEEVKTKALTRHFPTAARVLLGFFLLASGIAGLLNLTPPEPPNLPAAAVAFNAGLIKTGYMMPLIFGTQAVGGALLFLNRFVPLALAILAPFLVNSLAFHVFLVPAGLPIIVFLVALELFLAWSYREAFRPMLAMRAKSLP